MILPSVNSTPTNTAHTELHSMITFHHANTRGARAAKLRFAHLCVHKTVVIHVSCLIPCRTWHWPQAQLLSHPLHPPLLSFRRSLLYKRALWFSTHTYSLRCSSDRAWRPRELCLTGILGQIRIKSRKDLEILFLRLWTNLEKLVRRCPPSSHRCIPIMTQRRALQTRILKMDNNEKCGLTAVCTWARRKLLFFSKTHSFMETRSKNKYWREVQVHNVLKLITQEGRAWSQIHLKSHERLGNLLQCFYQEPGNQVKSSIFKNADPSNVGRSLLEGNKDHLLSQARSELMRQEPQGGSLNNCISELKDWNYRTLNTDMLSLDENKFVRKKNNLWRKRFSEILKSEACTKWEKNYKLTKSQFKN